MTSSWLALRIKGDILSNELVKNQHVLPKRSIERFCNENGMVQAHLVSKNRTFPAKPGNKIFTVNREWDQRSEEGYGKSIEDNYQSLADSVLATGRRSLSMAECVVVSKFYALWCFRSSIKKYDWLMQEEPAGDCEALTDEQKKVVELNHFFYKDENGVVPSRFKRGLAIQVAIDACSDRNPGQRWFVSQSDRLEFIVSDNPYGSFIVPFSPTMCFMCLIDVRFLSFEQVKKINFEAIRRSKFYYFARNLGVTICA